MHLHGSIPVVEEVARAVFGGILMRLGWLGGKQEPWVIEPEQKPEQ